MTDPARGDGAVDPARGLASLTAVALRAGYAAGAFSPVEVIDALRERCAAVDGVVNAFVTRTHDRARDEAARLPPERLRDPVRWPLLGVPVAVKDLIDVAGAPTTNGSGMDPQGVAARDAPVVGRLRGAGALIVGKTNLHEFACGLTADNPHHGRVANPRALAHEAGGSSGGSAAAVAAGEVPLALGTDTGGSIRIPAAFCGVVGFKPTHGAVSAVGVWPMARSLDHVGPLARTVEDAQLLFAAIRAPMAQEVGTPSWPVRIGVAAQPGALAPVEEIAHALAGAAEALEHSGCPIRAVALPDPESLIDVYDTISSVELAQWHVAEGLFPRRRDEYGADVAARIEHGLTIDPDEHRRAVAAREEIRARLDRLLREVDFLLTPVSPVPPPLAGAPSVRHRGADSALRSVVLPYQSWSPLAGLPSCAVCVGDDGAGLPIAVQLTGPRRSDAAVLRLAAALVDAIGAGDRAGAPAGHSGA